MNAERTIVVGLDGANFELLTPWIDAGLLPTIRRLVDDGVTGDLQSVLPPTTSPNWKAYATGKNPGKLGIFWWENVDTTEQSVYYPSERRSLHTEYWEYIGEQETIGIVGVPTTYPPRVVNGFYISGAPDGEESDYTHPPGLETKLDQVLDYRVTKQYKLKHNPTEATAEILDLIDARFRAAKLLIDEFDPTFAQISTFYINSLHHFFWDDDATLEAWQTVDDHLADIVEPNDNVVLMSDHGSNPIRQTFHVNSWLEREGYLSLQTNHADFLQKLGLTTDSVVPLLTRLGLRNVCETLAPQWVINRIPNDDGQLNRRQKTTAVDWAESDAVASGQGPVYLTLDSDAENYESLRTELRQRLRDVITPAGDPIAGAVHLGSDLYTDEYANERPDLVIEQFDNVHIPGGLGHSDVFTDATETAWIAENKRNGLFVAAGPDFATGKVNDISILDLAPTLLHLHGAPVPRDMDGNVITALFDDDSAAASRQIIYADTSTKTDEIHRIKTAVSRIR